MSTFVGGEYLWRTHVKSPLHRFLIAFEKRDVLVLLLVGLFCQCFLITVFIKSADNYPINDS